MEAINEFIFTHLLAMYDTTPMRSTKKYYRNTTPISKLLYLNIMYVKT